jgi:uncharacterized protein YdaU (DUF1376 family)
MAKVDIWMPVYIGDYLRDTQDLTAEEHGVYILLLMHYWQRKGDVGSDVKRLAIAARSSVEITQCVLDSYFILEDGKYKNKRADEELKAASVRSESARDNARKRWDNAPAMPNECHGNAPAYAPGDAECYAESMPNGCSSSSSSSSEKEDNIYTEEKTKKHKYGNEKNVMLSENRYKDLETELGESFLKLCIEELSSYKAYTGKTYKRDDLVIRKWVIDAVKKKQPTNSPTISSVSIATEKPTCKACGSTNLAPAWCRVCHWDYIQEPKQWLIDNPIEVKS